MAPRAIKAAFALLVGFQIIQTSAKAVASDSHEPPELRSILASWGVDSRKDMQLLLVCPVGTEPRHSRCAKESDFFGNRDYVDAISPIAYLKSVCPDAVFVAAYGSHADLRGRYASWADHPVKVSITFTGECKL